MSVSTKELQQLLGATPKPPNFKRLAMALLDQGADGTVRAIPDKKPTLLHILVCTNKKGAYNEAIAKVVNTCNILECRDGRGRTALQLLMDVLEQEGYPFDDFKQSAMTLAELGANITLQSTSGTCLLHILARKNRNGANNADMAKLVRLNPKVLESKDNAGRTALQSLMDGLYWKRCSSFDDFKQSAMTLVRLGANVTLQSTIDTHPTLLHILACNNENGSNNADMEKLIKLNPKVLDSRDRNGLTALQSLLDALYWKRCSFKNFKESAMFLARQKEANLVLWGKGGAYYTLLHALVLNPVKENEIEIDELIKLDQSLVDLQDNNGCTPVHSLLCDNPKVAVDLIEKLLSETNLGLKDKQGATLLHAACRSGNLPAVEYFITKGLSLTALTSKNETLLHYAVWSGDEALIQWLIDKKAIDINAQDESGETALHHAVRRRSNCGVVLLLHRLSVSTEELQQLLGATPKPLNFKRLAMALLDQDADVTVQAISNKKKPTLLHILVCTNKEGANNEGIAKVVNTCNILVDRHTISVAKPNILEGKDGYGRTALQLLMDAFERGKCTFFKQLATTVELSMDITLRITSGNQSTLLYILGCTNKEGVNNEGIAELVGECTILVPRPDIFSPERSEGSLLTDIVFGQLAMALFDKSPDITIEATSSMQPDFLHILTSSTNKEVANNKAMAELVDKPTILVDKPTILVEERTILVRRPNILECRDGRGRTALQLLMDVLEQEGYPFDDFKQSAMTLAELGANITLQSTSGTCLLHILARKNRNGANNADMAKLVRLNPKVLESKDNAGRTALQSLMDGLYWKRCSSFDDFKQSAMTLVRLGANVTLQSTIDTHPTLLHILACNNENGANNADMEKLIKLNPKVLDSRDRNGLTALQSLLDALYWKRCSFKNFKESAMFLARQKANLSLRGKEGPGYTLLHALVLNLVKEKEKEKKKEEEIDELINLNKSLVDLQDNNGCTPVHSLLCDNPKVAVDLIEKLLSETNLGLKDKQGATLLHAACRSGNLPAVEYFIIKGLSLTALTSKNETLLHYAVWSGDEALIQWLIDKKAIDINAQDKSGETALHRAVRRRNHEVVALLLRNRAAHTIENNKGCKPIELASSEIELKGLVSLFSPKAKFLQTIYDMSDYGESLEKNQGAPSEGREAMKLATELIKMADTFLSQRLEERDFDDFKPKFLNVLHSKDQAMSEYRIAWDTLLKNIAIALTGIGLFLIAGKLIYSKVTEGRALFFFQKPRTTREERIADIQASMELIPLIN